MMRKEAFLFGNNAVDFAMSALKNLADQLLSAKIDPTGFSQFQENTDDEHTPVTLKSLKNKINNLTDKVNNFEQALGDLKKHIVPDNSDAYKGIETAAQTVFSLKELVKQITEKNIGELETRLASAKKRFGIDVEFFFQDMLIQMDGIINQTNRIVETYEKKQHKMIRLFYDYIQTTQKILDCAYPAMTITAFGKLLGKKSNVFEAVPFDCIKTIDEACRSNDEQCVFPSAVENWMQQFEQKQREEEFDGRYRAYSM